MQFIPTYDVTLTTGGTVTIPLAASTSVPYEIGAVRVSGTQTLVSNFAVSPSGTAGKNMQVDIHWEAACTPSGNTVTIFGQAVPEELLSSDFIAVCTYDGSAWKVALLADWAATSIVNASRIEADAVTTSKILDANVTLAKLEALTSAYIIQGNGSNRPTAYPITGDVTAALGVFTIGAAKVLDSMIAAMDAAKLTGTLANARVASRSLGSLKTDHINYVLDSKYSDTGTTAVTTEETLYTYSLPAATVANDGESIRITVFGTFAANGNGKTIKVKVGTTVYVTNSVTTSPNAYSWKAEVLIERTGATGAVGGSNLIIDTKVNENVNINKSGITWANANTITVTGQNAVATANDIVCSMVKVEHLA